jgi:hypothetical protein
MTRNHDEERLVRALHDQAEHVRAHPVAFDDVRASARGIRRRRRVVGGVVGGVAAVLVAVALPLGLTAVDGSHPDRPVAPATSSPSPAPTTAPTPRPAPANRTVTLTARGADAGAPASVIYLRDRMVVRPGGAEQAVRASYSSIYPYRGGWVAVERRDGTPYVVRLDASGNELNAVPGGDRIAVSVDGVEVAWIESGDPNRLVLDTSNGHSDAPTIVSLPAGEVTTPVGFLDAGRVVYRVDGARPTSWVAESGSKPVRLRDVGSVSAVSGARGLLAAQTSSADDGTSCWAVRSVTGSDTGEVGARSCDWTFQAFSPDGSRLLGAPSDTDGLGASAVAVLDAETGKPVVTFERPRTGDAFVGRAVWEDDANLLASLYEDGSWHLLRLGVDGTVEWLDRSAGEAESSPFAFGAQP